MEVQIIEMENNHLELINLDEFDNFWNMNILSTDFASPSSFYIVAQYANSIVGFAGINFILDEAHIANIVVRKDKRNLKIGSKLLEVLIVKAKENSSLITLEVNEKNTSAISLYKKYGFKIIGSRKKYYNNQFDAYIMTKYF